MTPTRRVKVFLSVPETSTAALLSPSVSRSLQANSQIHVDSNLPLQFPVMTETQYPPDLLQHDMFGWILNKLGYAAQELSRIRTNVISANRIIAWSNNTAASNLEIDSNKNDNSENGFVESRRLVLSNNSALIDSLIPQHSLTTSSKNALTILSSVPVGSSGMKLVSARLGSPASTGTGGPIGFGDDILPNTFKSMQISLGSSLDTPCAATTTISLEKLGITKSGTGNDVNVLVKKVRNADSLTNSVSSLIVVR